MRNFSLVHSLSASRHDTGDSNPSQLLRTETVRLLAEANLKSGNIDWAEYILYT